MARTVVTVFGDAPRSCSRRQLPERLSLFRPRRAPRNGCGEAANPGECLQLLSLARSSKHFSQRDGSLPHSQQSSTGPYPEPDESSPYQPFPSLQDPPTDVFVFLVVSLLLIFAPKSCVSSWLVIRSTCPIHLIVLIVKLRSVSRQFVPLWSKCPPQHPVLKHPQSMFIP
jgi:hypothetical protein